VQFNTPGNYDVELTVSNSFGADSVTQSLYITILATAPIPVVADFEVGSVPPLDWRIESANGAFTWDEATGIIGSDGTFTDAAFVNNHDYDNAPAEDGLATYEFNLSGSVAPIVTFDVAYARYNANFFDGLRVDVSSDCGENYTPSGYFKSDTDLATVPDQTASFTPQNASDWRKDTVDLSPWIGSNVVVKFVNINGYGNNLYIDNINIDNAVGLNEHSFTGNVIVYPNPSTGIFNLVMNGLQNELINMQVYDVQGKLLQQNTVHVNHTYNTSIDMGSYTKGIYFLEIKGHSGVKRFKLTVI
jgi:PKD repeat protein